jgi:hypothetical protein
MQTFLPSPSFEQSAKQLDYRRLGKQRVEAYQILNVLTGKRTGGWVNHPATKMWRGYEDALKHYMNVMITEWVARGYNNNMELNVIPPNFKYPEWLGGTIHETHRAALLYKDFDHYKQFGWDELPLLDYYWPTQD